MAGVPMSGQFKTGKNKGRQYEIYQDPASATGYTRKNWDQNDTTNGGKPNEYFEPFNYAAAEVEAQSDADAAAARAARSFQQGAQQAASDLRQQRFAQGVIDSNGKRFNEGVRQFDTEIGFKRDELGFRREDAAADRDLKQDELGLRREQGNRELDLRELDTRTRLQLGLRELELREKDQGAGDMRSRERNVMDYLTTIGKLRLPRHELELLSQRAVAGIIPGAAVPAAPAAGAGAPAVPAPGTPGGGALTADQWQALAQGVTRDYEQRQIGQGSALAA